MKNVIIGLVLTGVITVSAKAQYYYPPMAIQQQMAMQRQMAIQQQMAMQRQMAIQIEIRRRQEQAWGMVPQPPFGYQNPAVQPLDSDIANQQEKTMDNLRNEAKHKRIVDDNDEDQTVTMEIPKRKSKKTKRPVVDEDNGSDDSNDQDSAQPVNRKHKVVSE